jgi:hypothetical protein
MPRVTKKHLDFLAECDFLLLQSKQLRKEIDLRLNNQQQTKGVRTMEGMDKRVEALWLKTFKLCGVYDHPKRLTMGQKEHQKLLLVALQNEIECSGRLLTNKKLEVWRDYYAEEESEDMVVEEKPKAKKKRASKKGVSE